MATGDVGITKKGVPGDQFARGLELHSQITLFAEGNELIIDVIVRGFNCI